ncbi:MAG: methionyl-tRNA formyltransferase [Burkholderiales bacterium]|nr:methionyl-tRNA formyltransferase [Burkholderiales bacterium]
MNIVFAGTPEFAAAALEALLRAGHAVTLVLTRPDRPAGRGLKARPSAVKSLATERGLPLLQPPTLKDQGIINTIAALKPDALVVAAYGLIVPPTLLDVPRLGGINIHASLLPRWRGAAPIQRALLAGDQQTGITIMQMDAGLDTGAILLQEATPIGADDTAQSLHDRLAELGGRLIVRALAAPLVPRRQDAAAATYADKIDRREALIDWREDAAGIERRVRAFDPVPGASSMLNGTTIKIWRARVERGVSAPPGTICEAGSSGVVVACGRDGLRLLELQRAGGKRLPVSAFIAGFDMARELRFGV